MVVDKISLDEERRQAELLSACMIPAASFFAQKPLVTHVPTKDTIGKAITNISTTFGPKSSYPELDEPEDADYDEVRLGVDSLRELIDREGDLVDDQVHALFLLIQDAFTERLATTRDLLVAERTYSDQIEKKRSDEIEKQLALTKDVSTWTMVEKSLSTIGLIAAGVAGITAGAIPLGAAAITLGVLQLLDQIMEEKAKKTIALWMARATNEEQQAWLDRIHLFSAAAAMAISFGIAAPVAAQYGVAVATKYAAQIALQVAQTGATGVKGVYEWLLSNQKALMIELDAFCTLAQKNVNKLFYDLQERSNVIYELYKNMHDIESKRDSLSRQMLRIQNS